MGHSTPLSLCKRRGTKYHCESNFGRVYCYRYWYRLEQEIIKQIPTSRRAVLYKTYQNCGLWNMNNNSILDIGLCLQPIHIIRVQISMYLILFKMHVFNHHHSAYNMNQIKAYCVICGITHCVLAVIYLNIWPKTGLVVH